MARQARQESITGYYHVMMRGINREFLFKRPQEKQLFMQLVKEQQTSNLLELAAWCVMGNHVHMLVKADIGDLSKAVKIISLKFAAHYNRFNERIGPVFGDRFRSENIGDDRYLLGAMRYIHLNPVKSKLASNVSNYQWGSYNEYIDGTQYISSVQREFILGLFGGNLPRLVEFHTRHDDTEYLETREDLEAYREEKAGRILEQFCIEKGITKASQLHTAPEFFSEICLRLTESGLTLRKAAEILETTHTRVHKALQDEE